jgi:cobalt/nickel transport system permease protein
MSVATRFTGVKLCAALLALFGIGLIPAENWPVLVAVIGLTLAALAMCGVTARTLWRRLVQFAPLALGLGLAAGLSRPGVDAGVWLAALMLRCLSALLIGLWLVQVLTARELLAFLTRCRLPAALVTALNFMLRYLVVLWEEHERLRLAQLSRAGGPAGGWARWRAAIERLGSLLIRALDRAERTHRALLARGWDGSASWRM